MGTSPWIVSDDLWERIEPLLPRKKRRFRHAGRKSLP
ncbi:IS5/IS1182 family transposase, partial [Streptomyces anulatus]